MSRTTGSLRGRTKMMPACGLFMAGALLIALPEGRVSAEGDGGCPTVGSPLEKVLQGGAVACPPPTTVAPPAPSPTIAPEVTQPPATTPPPVATEPPVTTTPPVTIPPVVTQPPTVTQPPVAAGGPTPPSQTPSQPTTPSKPSKPSKPTLPATGQRQFDILLALGGAAMLGSGVWLVRLAAARRPRRLH